MTNTTLKEQFIFDTINLVKDANMNKAMYENSLHQLRYSLGGGRSPHHATSSLINPICNRHINIDTNIASLIEYIWLNGISTKLSCENNVPIGYIWILFKTASDLELFLGIVFKDPKPNDDFNDRGLPGWGKPDSWYYNIHTDTNLENKVSISISVRFPQKDYDIVLEKLKSHYELNKKTTLSAK